MLPDPVAVHPWPQGLQRAVAALRADGALTVLSVPAPLTEYRDAARAHIRTALCGTLAEFLDQPAASIHLVSHPGQAIRVARPVTGLHVSVSHAPGMSLAAVATGRAVGVDLMRLGAGAQVMPEWVQVARDYLGPVWTQLLQDAQPWQRPAAFAQAWTQLEARLKCLGLPLSEWTPALAQQLQTCPVMPLALPAGWCGAVAVRMG